LGAAGTWRHCPRTEQCRRLLLRRSWRRARSGAGAALADAVRRGRRPGRAAQSGGDLFQRRRRRAGLLTCRRTLPRRRRAGRRARAGHAELDAARRRVHPRRAGRGPPLGSGGGREGRRRGDDAARHALPQCHCGGAQPRRGSAVVAPRRRARRPRRAGHAGRRLFARVGCAARSRCGAGLAPACSGRRRRPCVSIPDRGPCRPRCGRYCRGTAPGRVAPAGAGIMIIGTAGHIDHGKTSLVRVLTGVDTDRLKEEKERGISIDLGFAYLPTPDGSIIGFIDVPGHERFVHTMVAGASGIDFVVLVVAADDGVMPQTLEHLAIVEMLGIRRGVVALTKADLAAPARREEIASDISSILSGTGLDGAPVIPVSSVTGEGIEELRRRLFAAAHAFGRRATRGRFRLAVDRSFTLAGAGTVVTGTVLSGQVAVGDRVVVSPPGFT